MQNIGYWENTMQEIVDYLYIKIRPCVLNGRMA